MKVKVLVISLLMFFAMSISAYADNGGLTLLSANIVNASGQNYTGYVTGEIANNNNYPVKNVSVEFCIYDASGGLLQMASDSWKGPLAANSQFRFYVPFYIISGTPSRCDLYYLNCLPAQ